MEQTLVLCRCCFGCRCYQFWKGEWERGERCVKSGDVLDCLSVVGGSSGLMHEWMEWDLVRQGEAKRGFELWVMHWGCNAGRVAGEHYAGRSMVEWFRCAGRPEPAGCFSVFVRFRSSSKLLSFQLRSAYYSILIILPLPLRQPLSLTRPLSLPVPLYPTLGA